MLFLLLSGACVSVDPGPCDPGRPSPGEVRAGIVECEEALPSGSNAAVGDVMLANSEVYALIRMDSEAKYFLHVGGGSLVDMGEWGRSESLAEGVPLSGGRWMRSAEVDWGIDEEGAWFSAEGVAEPIHFLAAESSGSQRITYRLSNTGRSLELDGADGLLFLGEEGGQLIGEAWEGGESRFSMDGVAQDLGGAIRFSGSSLRVETIEEEPVRADPQEQSWNAEFSDAVRVELGVESYPSRRSREATSEVLDRLSEQGMGLVVLAPVDEVGVPPILDESHARALGGSRADAPGMGSVVVWPVSAKSHRPAHGAALWEGLDALQVLSSAKNASAGRRAMVDLDWVEAAGPMEEWTVVPELILLKELADFERIRGVWSSGSKIGFAGPNTWVPADTSSLPSLAAMERGLLFQKSTASSGPLLLADREASSRLEWDRLSVRIRLSGEQTASALEVWSVDGKLYEDELLGEEAEERTILVPAEKEVWALLRGEDWAVSSVLVPQQSGLVER